MKCYISVVYFYSLRFYGLSFIAKKNGVACLRRVLIYKTRYEYPSGQSSNSPQIICHTYLLSSTSSSVHLFFCRITPSQSSSEPSCFSDFQGEQLCSTFLFCYELNFAFQFRFLFFHLSFCLSVSHLSLFSPTPPSFLFHLFFFPSFTTASFILSFPPVHSFFIPLSSPLSITPFLTTCSISSSQSASVRLYMSEQRCACQADLLYFLPSHLLKFVQDNTKMC